MENKLKYDKVFMETFLLDESALGDSLLYNENPAWDSVGHMTLVAALEDAFGVSLETDDIIDFSSYKKGLDILSKYGIAFEADV